MKTSAGFEMKTAFEKSLNLNTEEKGERKKKSFFERITSVFQ